MSFLHKAFGISCCLPCLVFADSNPSNNPNYITPTVRTSPDRMGGYVSGDFLYWTARQESLEYAYDGATDTLSSYSVTEEGSLKFPEWKWDSGFKVGVGYYTAYDGWDVFAEYTRLMTSISGNTFSDDTSSTLRKVWQPLNFNQVNATILDQASCSWELQFNAIDLSLGRNFLISKDLGLRPYVGLKSVWMEQKYIVNYEVLDKQANKPVSSTMDQHQRSDAIGLRTGIDASWGCTKVLSIFGRIAASILWEKFKLHRKDTNYTIDFDTEVETSTVTLLEEKTLSIAEPFVEAALGFELQHFFSRDRYRLALRTSYEFQIFFDQSQFIRSVQDTSGNGGNLTLQGLTMKLQFDF